MKFTPIVLAVLIVASAITPGLAISQDSELILRVAMQDDMKGTNPLTCTDVWSWNVLGYLYDGPMNKDPETDELIPYIAVGSSNISGKAASWSDCAIGNFGYSPQSSWANSTKQEAIIFYDFENVKWHDGVQMEIRDILFSMHVAGQVPEWSSSMNPLKDKGGSGGNYSSTSWLHVYKVWESADGMQAALRFQLQKPFADFFRSTLSAFLLPEHIWNSEKAGQLLGAKIWCDPDYASNPWKVAAAQSFENNPPVGNGPFKFKFWEKGQMSKIDTFREHFFRDDYKYRAYIGTDEYGRSLARQPNIDAITYKIFKTAEAAVLALKNDDIDYIAWSIPPTFLQELMFSAEDHIGIIQSPEQGFFYVGYNMRRESFGYQDGNASNEDVGKPLRQAIAHCIDKKRIVTRLLLNLGVAGTGPIYPGSEWYNDSIPTYSFDPNEAKNILRNSSYKLTDGSVDAEGKADITKARDGNWWLNPDGTPIGSGEGGLIQIIEPWQDWDIRRGSLGQMIAQQLRDIGVYAKSVVMDFGSIVDRTNQRDFDMYILGWHISSEPTDFLNAFFHSDNAANGQNYPGYQNKSFDNLIDLARSTGNPDIKKKAVCDAQAAICYDLPYDVLYFRTNIEAYRSDRFTGWVVGESGSIFNWKSIMNIQAPGPYKVSAQFVSPPSAVLSNSSSPIIIYVRDQDGNALENAHVWLETSVGSLLKNNGTTGGRGKFTTIFNAPYVPLPPSLNLTDPNYQNRENERNNLITNGTQAIIQIVTASYVTYEGTMYNPSPSHLISISIFPEGANYLSVSISADPDIIDPDMAADGTLGFTYVDVIVTNQNKQPVQGASVALTSSPAVPIITPAYQVTDADGKARFKVTSIDLQNDDESTMEYTLKALAIHPTDTAIQGENTINLLVVDSVYYPPPPPHPPPFFPPTELIVLGFVISIIATIYVVTRRKPEM